MKKLFISLLLLPSALVYAYDTKVGELYYDLNQADHTASVTHGERDYEAGIEEHYAGDIVIPERITVDGEDYVVNDIGYNAFYNSQELTSISIPATVQNIGEASFDGCTGLTSLVIPNGVDSIGLYAFFGCSGLKSVTISPSVRYINEYAFGYCENATDLVYSEGCTTALATHLSYLTSVSIPNTVTCIADSAFRECMYLESVTLPESVTSIGREAFAWCLYLKDINLPDAVTSIGREAFSYCESLPVEGHIRYVDRYLVGVDDEGHYETSLTVKPGTQWIGDHAFCNCVFMPSISLPEGVKYIGCGAFENCLSLQSFDIPLSVTTIESMAYAGCQSFTSITIPHHLTGIADNAFVYCDNVRQLIYEEGCTSTFCLMLPSVASALLPSTLTSICDCAFQNCENLTSVILPDGVTRIGDFAFDGCIALPQINIPAGVSSIGKYAFVGCSSLPSVALPDKLEYIGDYAFAGCSALASINIPASVKQIGDFAFHSCPSLPIQDGLIYADTYTVGPADHSCRKATIRQGTRWIGTEAFYTCTDLKDVSIPRTVETIQDNAFGWCFSLASVTVDWDNPLALSESVFYSSPISSSILYVPKGTRHIYADSPIWSEFGSIKENQSSGLTSVSDATLAVPAKILKDGTVILRQHNRDYCIDGTLLK